MQNVKLTRTGDKLLIEVDLTQSLGPSKSGKTRMIATTEGNATVPGTDAKIGLNIFRPL